MSDETVAEQLENAKGLLSRRQIAALLGLDIRAREVVLAHESLVRRHSSEIAGDGCGSSEVSAGSSPRRRHGGVNAKKRDYEEARAFWALAGNESSSSQASVSECDVSSWLKGASPPSKRSKTPIRKKGRKPIRLPDGQLYLPRGENFFLQDIQAFLGCTAVSVRKYARAVGVKLGPKSIGVVTPFQAKLMIGLARSGH